MSYVNTFVKHESTKVIFLDLKTTKDANFASFVVKIKNFKSLYGLGIVNSSRTTVLTWISASKSKSATVTVVRSGSAPSTQK